MVELRRSHRNPAAALYSGGVIDPLIKSTYTSALDSAAAIKWPLPTASPITFGGGTDETGGLKTLSGFSLPVGTATGSASSMVFQYGGTDTNSLE